MKSLRSAAGVFLAIVVLAFIAVPLTAQVQNGQITGDVSDPSGATVPNATVNVKNPETGYSATATAGGSGHYVVNSVPVGTYTVSVSAPGFKTLTRSNVVVNAGSIAHMDVKLQVGQVNEVVEVTGAPPQIDVETSRLAQVVGSTQVANLPLNGRNVYDLIQLAPGAVNVRGVLSENGGNTVVNGLRENFNGFLINGVSNKGLSGGTVTTPIQDTVQEFQELTLNMSAQYGNSAGSITNLVTKSGTNDVHGSGWWFGRNDVFDANNFFLNQQGVPKQPLRFNQFGGTIGGPIVKNKLFVFLSAQGDKFRESGPPSQVQVESPAFRQAVIQAFPNSTAALLYRNFPPTVTGTPSLTLNDYVTSQGGGAFSGSGFADFGSYLCPDNSSPAIAAKFATLIGVTPADQTSMGAAGCSTIPALQAGLFDRNAPFLFDTTAFNGTQDEPYLGTGNLFNGWELSGRIDYNMTDKDRIFGQLNWVRVNDQFGAPNTTSNSNGRGPGFLNPLRSKSPNFQFSYVHTFTPKLLNEFRAGYVGNLGPDIKVAQPGVPDIRFDDGEMGFGSYAGYPQTFHENIYSYSDMVSISHGRHNVKIGADVRRNIENSEFNVARPSFYFFDPLFFAADSPYTESAGVDPGIVSGTPAHLSSNIRHWRNWEVGAYFQDDWKVSSRLTLNLGIRYDLFQRHHELDNQVTTFILGPGNNFIDNITTGAGQVRDASAPLGTPQCPKPEHINDSGVAGVCGPGGFAAADALGKGDHNNFGPRVGFAYDMFGNGKTSLRGGFGVSYEGTLYNPLSNSRWNLPFYSFNAATNALGGDVQYVVYGPTVCDPTCHPDPTAVPTFTGPPTNPNQGTGAQAAGNLTGWDPSNQNLSTLSGIIFPQGVRDPYVYNYFLGFQHEIVPKTVVEVDYVGTTGHKIFRAENVNRIPGGRLPVGSCVVDNLGRTLCGSTDSVLDPAGRLNPNYGKMRVWRNVVNSNYNALQASLRHQLSAGVSFTFNYTWSHALDDGSTWHSGATSSNGAAAGEGYTTDYTLKNIDRGNSIFDIRHRLVANYVWELPWLKSQQGFIGHVLGGWQWNGIFSYQTGAHWSAYDGRLRKLVNASGNTCTAADVNAGQCVNVGGDYNLDGERNDRPNALSNSFTPSHDQWANGWGGIFAPGGGFFSSPCLGCVGNLARNTFVGPSYWAFDSSLFKNIKVTERVNMQFRAEAFNLFNHTNFELPGAGGATNNQINRKNFGQAGSAFNPRQMQFGLKLNF